jgi:hypothetical protein
MAFCTEDDDDDLDDIDWDELYRDGREDLIAWGKLLQAGFEEAVDWAEETLSLPAPTLEDLLATFDLEDAFLKRQATILWNTGEDRAAAHDAVVEAKQDVDETRAARDPADGVVDRVIDAGLGAASATLGKIAGATEPVDVPKDAVHVSDRAILFKNWHLQNIPDSYIAPYSEILSDQSIVENIKKARSMLEPIPHGTKGVQKRQPAGTMQWTKYPPKKTEGWMYVEPSSSDYSQWFWGRLKELYEAAKVKADEADLDPSLTADKKMAARAPMRRVAACKAVMRQEGLPSAINTYDGTILTWCSGLAAQGALPRVFYQISKDPNVYKAMYLCGFLYQGAPNEGAYQVVDIAKISSVYFRGDRASRDAMDPQDPSKVKYTRGTRDYAAYKVLQKFVDQLELVYLLIMIARSPLTRASVFNVNFALIEGMVDVGSAEKIATEALYVFIGEVKHNWDTRDNLVDWAVAHFDATEALLAKDDPSEERDRAIAKGVFRYVLRGVQQGAWTRAVAGLKVAAKKQKTKTPTPAIDFHLVMEKVTYSFDRLIDNYWKPMQTGKTPQGYRPHTMDGSTLPVPDFPIAVPRSVAPSPDEVVVWDALKNRWSLGKQAQCDFLFPTDAITLIGFDAAGNVIIDEGGARRTVTTKGAAIP